MTYKKTTVRPKKHLGQHFLKDEDIARRIVDSMQSGQDAVLEVGPGTGVLTKYLLEKSIADYRVAEIDRESVRYLKKHFPVLEGRILEGDFLQMDLNRLFSASGLAIIGNFPYNISSQIFFKVLDHLNKVKEVVCMVQKEVGERLCSDEGNKDYGILSVLLGAYYDREYLFTVSEHVFDPPPKVKSAVIRVTRNLTEKLPCDEILFKRLVKQGFNNRRKTLRNALKPLELPLEMGQHKFLDLRAEQLSVAMFVELTLELEKYRK